MSRVTLLLLAVVLAALATEGRRMRRGFNNSGYGSSGYGRGSDERDASVSQENNGGGGCNSSNDRSYSGSRELAYSRDGRQPGQPRGGRSFTRSSASATASAAASAQHHKNNNLVL